MAKIIKLEVKGVRNKQAIPKEKKATLYWLAQMIDINTILDDHYKNEPCPPKYS